MSQLNLSHIVHEVVGSNAQDKEHQRDLFGDLIRESERARALGQIEIDFLLDVSVELYRHLAEGEPPTLEDVQRLVTRLLVNAECKAHRHVEAMQVPADDEVTGQVSEVNEEIGSPLVENTSETDTVNADTSPMPAAPLKMAGNKRTAPGSLKLADCDPAPMEIPDLRCVKLGQVLAHLGMANVDQIDQALQVQGHSKQRIGEVLSRLGQLHPEDLRAALDLHTKVRDYARTRSADEGAGGEVKVPFGHWQETLLGEILLAAEEVDEEQLFRAVSIQRATGLLLGEVLIQQGMCSTKTVLEAIRLQEKLRNGRKSLSMPPASNFNRNGQAS